MARDRESGSTAARRARRRRGRPARPHPGSAAPMTTELERTMGATIHFLQVGDEAGPAPAPFALFGVDLSLDGDRRPYGWEENLTFNGRVMPGLRSPLTMWLIRAGGLNVVVDTGCTPGRTDADEALARNSIWVRHEPGSTVEAQ